MYAEEETELRDLIIQNLESCGFLNKIKAELRAGVFLAFEEDDNLRNKIPLFNKKFDDFIATSEGNLAVSIVREFLEYFKLNFTLSVFDPEIARTTPCLSRIELCDRLKLDNQDFEGPIISALTNSKKFTDSVKQDSVDSVISNPEFGQIVGTSSDANKSSESEPKSDHVQVKEKRNNSVFNSETIKANEILKDYDFKDSSEGDTSEKNDTYTKNDLNESYINDEKKSDISDPFIKDKNISIKDATSAPSLDHDPFFDEPVPSEKTYFNLPRESDIGALKNNSLGKLSTVVKNDALVSEKSTLSSLRGLPALSTKDTDWTFSREPKTSLPSLDSLHSVSSSENSNDGIMNPDIMENTVKKDDSNESNEESSDKQINSEESIEEDIEEDFSAGVDDLLNSSLSLADDATSDQTVSQGSTVEGVDHMEPCHAIN